MVVEGAEMEGEEEKVLLSVGPEKEVEEVSVEELKFADAADAKSVPEADSLVDHIDVDVLTPGVVVVGGAEGNEDVLAEPPEEVAEPEKVDVVEPEKVEVAEPEKVEVAEPEKVEVAEPEKVEVAGRGDVELTSEGDSVVDNIQVDVGGSGDKGDEKVEREEVPLESVGGFTEMSSGEVAVQNTADAIEEKPLQPEHVVVAGEKGEDLGVEGQSSVENNDSIERGTVMDAEDSQKKPEVASEGTKSEIEADILSETAKPKGIHEGEDGRSHPDDSMSDEDTDDMIFGSSDAARKFIEELEQESHALANSSHELAREIDGQIVTDSEEEEDETDDDEGDGKELLDSAALASLLKAVTGSDANGGSVTITSQDGSRLFSVERPAGLGSSLQSLRPGPRTNLNRPSLFSNLTPSFGGREYEENLSEEEKKKLEKLQQIRVKFLRLVHRLGLSPDESVAGQVLYRLALLGGRQNTPSFSLDDAKRMAMKLEMEQRDDLDFSVNMLVLGKDGVGKSATINSIFGEEKTTIDAFEAGTDSVKEISGLIDGVKVCIVDTPGLKRSVLEQGHNRSILSSVKKFTNKTPADVVLYVDRLDSQSRDLNDLPLLKTINSVLGSSIWRSAVIALTHSASAPPDGPSGAPLSYEVFVSQRSHVVQQSIGQSVGDLRMMVPSLTNPVSLVENHPSCRKNRDGHKILPNGQVWRPQLLLLCYSMKILSEANSISKPQDLFDHRKLFGFRARSPPLPYMLSSMLQSRSHPKLPSELGGDNADSDIDLDDFSDSDHEGGEEDEYDQLPPFKPLRKAQIAKLSKEQRIAYFEEYDYRVKLLQKKQWKEELRRMREFKKRGGRANDYNLAADNDDEADSGSAAPVAVPLPDMALPPSFDGDNPAYRYRFLEPTSQFLARPVLDTHGWDHDCGYDGVNVEHNLAILNRFPATYTFQITKDKKDFTVSLDSSIAKRLGENVSTLAGFDVQSMGKQLAYIFRGETKIKKLKRNKVTGGVSFTVLGENVVPAFKIEDQITFAKRHTLVGSAGVVRSKHESAYGANFELQSRDDDYPIGQVRSTLSLSMVKWRGDLALGLNGLVQLGLGRNSKVTVKAGINNKMSGQVSLRTSSTDHLSLALAAVIPTVLSVYRKLFSAEVEKYSIY
ncbi:Translocase of chloroplast 159- chloroplastic [Striga hermonthica]|uniref:Translocase of chloroplast 159- chloroplastic n=1 Tax=Striga hermonthica TaxID=68872 RepID=A0A9N7RFE8_STRHE|nr:Translocase of chloroplast 159- chloroplastic [Striga hermonthica]